MYQPTGKFAENPFAACAFIAMSLVVFFLTVTVLCYQMMHDLFSTLPYHWTINIQFWMTKMSKYVLLPAFVELMSFSTWLPTSLKVLPTAFQLSVMTSLCFSVALLGCLNHHRAHFMSERRNIAELREKTGDFVAFGRSYYRERLGSPLQLKTLIRSTTETGIDGQVKVVLHYDFSEVSCVIPKNSPKEDAKSPKNLKAECAITGGTISRVKNNGSLPKGSVVLGVIDVDADEADQFCPLGMGLRMGNHLISARHLFAGHSDLVMYNMTPGGAKMVPISLENANASPCEVYAGTYLDVATVEVTLGDWSKIGVQSLCVKNISNMNATRITVYGVDHEGFLMSKGALKKHPTAAKYLGMTEHTASTLAGFSGSGLYATDSQGNPVIVGLHTNGTLYHDNQNLAIGADALRFMLKKLMKIESPLDNLKVEDTLVHMCESACLTYDRQIDFEEPDFSPDAAHIAYIRNAVQNEVVDARIRDYINGGDEGGEFLSEDDLATPDQDAPLPRYGKRRNQPATREKWSAFTKDDGFMSESIHFEKGKKTSYPAAKMLSGTWDATTEKAVSRWWARYVGEKVPTPLKTEPALKPTPAQVNDIFQRMYDGDYSAIADATLYDYKGIFTAFDDNVVGDPLGHFKVYLDTIKQCEWTSHHTDDFLRFDKDGKQLPPLHPPQDDDYMPDAFGLPMFTACGKTTKTGKKCRAMRGLTPAQKELFIALNLEDEWALPPTHVTDMIDSLRSQASIQKPGHLELNEAQFFDELHLQCPDNTKKVKPLAGTTGIQKLFDSLEEKSSGWTTKYKNKTKKSLARMHPTEVIAIVIARLILRAASWRELPSMSPEAIVRAGLADPKEINIKAEPHGKSKIGSKRWRLIWVCSLIDMLCQGMTSYRQNKAEIERYQEGSINHVAAGLGHHDAGIQRLGEAVAAMASLTGKVHWADARGWDLSVSRDHIMWDATARIFCADLPSREAEIGFGVLVMCDALCNTAHVLALDNKLYASFRFGQTASGALNTTSQNNRARGAGIRACNVYNRITCGDDLLADDLPDEEELAKHGTMTKPGSAGSAPFTGPFEFTSHLWEYRNGKWHAKFQNLAKSCAKLCFGKKPPAADQLAGIYFAIRHDPESIATFDEFLTKSGWSTLSPSDWLEPEDWNELL